MKKNKKDETSKLCEILIFLYILLLEIGDMKSKMSILEDKPIFSKRLLEQKIKEVEELKKQNLLLSIANAELQDRFYSMKNKNN